MNPILRDPVLNKGTAFTQDERDRYHLNGLLPYHVSSLEEQVIRRYENFKAQTSDLAKHLFLSDLQNRNEVLFYKLASEHIGEMLPLIYTPTVGDVSLHYSVLYNHPRGLYLAYPFQDKLEKIIEHYEPKEIDVIVVTDGERILGLGDLGAGGMAISIGKLALYTVFGGIYPGKTLPIVLDVGTNNPTLLQDPSYLGWRHERIQGKEYENFVDRFVQAIKKKYPNVLLQWEDFGRAHARPLLEKYQSKICSFNDDIQGTASVALSAVLSAVKKNQSTLQEQRIVVFGGGSAGIGICHHFVGALKAQGMNEEEARKLFYVIDVEGLIHTGQSEILPHQRPFARAREEIASWTVANSSKMTLLDVVKAIRPTVLIGVSAQSGAFTQEVVETMAKYVERPIIFPLSNPTSKAEAHPSDLLHWTKGKALVATGSPFEGFAQCNNVYIFPGVGLGVIACKAKAVSDAMFYQAADILSRHSPLLQNPLGSLFPPFHDLAKVSREIALGVIEVAQKEGSATLKDDPKKLIEQTFWTPHYK